LASRSRRRGRLPGARLSGTMDRAAAPYSDRSVSYRSSSFSPWRRPLAERGGLQFAWYCNGWRSR
jgi:hypothetical protein